MIIIRTLSHAGEVQYQRTLSSEIIKLGSPNLLVVPPGNLLSCYCFTHGIMLGDECIPLLAICIQTDIMLSFFLDHILRTALSLYMENHYDHPLPTPEEVLLCTPTTTAEEVLTLP